MKVIGFSAKMQGGKTTSTNAVIEHFQGGDYIIHEISFARFLKEVVARCFFGVPEFTESMKKAIVNGKTGREWLQIVGTDWFREAHAPCWVNSAKAEIEEMLGHSIDQELNGPPPPSRKKLEHLFVISDVRFENELKFVHQIGGHCIRLLRNPHPDCTHASELALDMTVGMTEMSTTHEYPADAVIFDALIDNTEMTLTEKNITVTSLVERLLQNEMLS